MTQATGKRHPGATQKVLEYLRKNMNVTIPYAEISKETGLPSATVSNSVGYLIQAGNLVERPIQGTVVLRSGPPKVVPQKRDRELYEYIGKVDDSRVLLRDETDGLWNAGKRSCLLLEQPHIADTEW